MRSNFQRITATVLICSISACASRPVSAPIQYASKAGTMKVVTNCPVSPLNGSSVFGLQSYWNGACGIDGATGDGLAVWYQNEKRMARYTGRVSKGILDGDGGIFVDPYMTFKGSVKNGRVLVGILDKDGNRFEGKFDENGGFAHGILHKKDGMMIAGRFQNGSPIGTFVVRDVKEKWWYGEIQNGQIRLRNPVPPRNLTAAEQAEMGLVLLASGALAFVFAYSGLLLLGGAAALAAGGAVAGGAVATTSVVRIIVVLV